MPTPSSSFEGVVPLPPRIVAIRHAIFEAPDETGLSIAVPTNYALFTADNAPSSSDGNNGDWWIYVLTTSTKIYRKVIGVWTLVSTISSGSGGGGGDLSGITISDSIFDNGTITGSTISTSSLVAPTITGGTATGLVIVGASITGATITSSVVTGLPTPTASSDAATKAYVDGLAAGFQAHDAVVAATISTNVTLTGGAPDTLDGVSLSANDRVLVKNQTNPIQNGIYKVTTLGSGSNGTWSRTTDADSGHELDSAYVLVTGGTSNGGTSWVVSGAPLIGTDPVNWIIFFAVTSIPASAITGSIVAGQIGSVNASSILGTITAGQIGSINAGQIAGTITASQIGSVNASVIAGTINSTQIGSVNASSIAGTITASQVGSINANTIIGVITTNQLVDQILNTQRLIASDISVVRRVASLPSLPNGDYPVGALALNTTNKTLYQNVSNVWQVVTASSNVVGTLTANDIASVNANSLIGLIIASQISTVNATSLIGGINAGQINSVNASSITGSITASQISSVNASSITGSITSSQISSVNAAAITGTITAGQISQVNASTITLGSLSAINYTIGSGITQTTITSSGITVGNLVITGFSNQNSIIVGNGQTHPVTINGGAAAASIAVGINGGSGGNGVTLTDVTGGQILIGSVGRVCISGSGRLEIGTPGANSIAFTTSNIERWFIGGSDGHLKSDGGDIRYASGTGHTVNHWDGNHSIAFSWSGGLHLWVDFTDLGQIWP